MLTVWSDSCETLLLITCCSHSSFSVSSQGQGTVEFPQLRLNIMMTAKKNLLYIIFFVNLCHCLKKSRCPFTSILYLCTCSDTIRLAWVLEPNMKILTKYFVVFFHEVLKPIHIYCFHIVETKAVLDLPDHNSWLLIDSCPLNLSSFLIRCPGRQTINTDGIKHNDRQHDEDMISICMTSQA